MKNFSKAGLLIVTLVIPALIFVFLKFFARNHYDLPYFDPKTDTRGKVVVQNGDTLFRKVDESCTAVSGNDFGGKLTVISILPKECKDDCKLLLEELKRINSLVSEITDLRILTLTESAQFEGRSLPAEIGSGDWELKEIPGNMINSCFIKKVPENLKAEKVDLASRLILIDREGYTRGYYNGTDPAEIDRLMAEIKILDYERK